MRDKDSHKFQVVSRISIQIHSTSQKVADQDMRAGIVVLLAAEADMNNAAADNLSIRGRQELLKKFGRDFPVCIGVTDRRTSVDTHAAECVHVGTDACGKIKNCPRQRWALHDRRAKS
jgi:hypothetical protein